ncbi:MAG TPA: hypothetical protein VHY30_05225 [Verrucomicrobiae bacterium]|jgi:hypothetical protein|nr:hypothetical protein [Verrucomicrobiae bacterium]
MQPNESQNQSAADLSSQQQPANGRKIKKGEFIGVGAAIQAFGIVSIILGFVFGEKASGSDYALVCIILGVLLLIIGGRMAFKWICFNCGNKISGKEVKICPVCHCNFTD